MEEIYILQNGSSVDISGYSSLEKTHFFLVNGGAKRQTGSSKPKTKKIPNLRLTDDKDVETMQDRGILPPPSSKFKYDSALERGTIQGKVKGPYDKIAVKVKYTAPGTEEEMQKFVDEFTKNPKTAGREIERRKINDKKAETDADLSHPYLYYSSKNQQKIKQEEQQNSGRLEDRVKQETVVEDDFVGKNYNRKELESLGVNPEDFDGFLNKKGYKQDYLSRESKGLFKNDGNGIGVGGYNIAIAKEKELNKYLMLYMNNMQDRDVNKQKLNQALEIADGVRDKEEIVPNQLFDPQGTKKYIEKNYPTLTKKLKETDVENTKIYEESKRGGSDFFSWETPGKLASSGWNAMDDRINQLSSSFYETVGMDKTAEGIRMEGEQTLLFRPNTREVSYVSGGKVQDNGTNYIVDNRGQIYDADSKIRVTDLFDKKKYDDIVEKAKYAPSDYVVSAQGVAVQTTGVLADMLLQSALTYGVGTVGAAATAFRVASAATKIAPGLNNASALLKMLPIERATGYAMISQGVLGASSGYEDTLKEARDAGIDDSQAQKLAISASEKMGLLYAVTGVINPQTKVVENIFGSKNVVKKAIEQYGKRGEVGFVQYFDDIIKNAPKTLPKNAIGFVEEGTKEVIQENVQQVGEIGVNRTTNENAGQKIMNDVITADDFINTSMLSFLSSGLISKAKMPSFHLKNDANSDLRALSTLAKNKTEFVKIIDGLTASNSLPLEQARKLKEDVEIYNNTINHMPKNTPAEIAMPIMRELDKVRVLNEEKKKVDKIFHPRIDRKIEGISVAINKILVKEQINQTNKKIQQAIDKGVAKGTTLKSFETTEQIQDYLINEIGMPKEVADVYTSETAFVIDATTIRKYSKNPETVTDKQQVAVMNESFAVEGGVMQHEFLHGVLSSTLKDNPMLQRQMGGTLILELQKIDEQLQKEGSKDSTQPNYFIQKVSKYIRQYNENVVKARKKYDEAILDAKGDPLSIAAAKVYLQEDLDELSGIKWEEALTSYSDALRLGYVKYNEGIFVKLGDVIRRVLQGLGIKDIKFNSGKDVYNFIKDYNASVDSGNWGKALKKMSNKGAEINLKKEGDVVSKPKTKEGSTFVTTAKFSLREKKSSEKIKEDVNKHYDKEKWSSATKENKDDNTVINNALYDILSEYDFAIKGKAISMGLLAVPGYDKSHMDMIAETKIAMIPLIRNFNRRFFVAREEYKKELIASGVDPKSPEFKKKVEEQDEKGYATKKGLEKENTDLNAYINSQLTNKMYDALKTGNVTEQKFTEEFGSEGFKESRVLDEDMYFSEGSSESGDFFDEGIDLFEEMNDFETEQDKLFVLLKDPVFKFVDEKGIPIEIEITPMFAHLITNINDPSIAANIKLKTETDPKKIKELQQELKDLERGLFLESKPDRTEVEEEELKELKSFKSFSLQEGLDKKTFKALSKLDTPARIVSNTVAREILFAPNIATLEFRNFKERFKYLAEKISRRITFTKGAELDKFMYDNWQMIYNVINEPYDPVTGQATYVSKKLPPRLKETDEKGNISKVKGITRVKFLQSFYPLVDAKRIINKYGGKDAEAEINQLESEETGRVDEKLSQNAHFDRRTALTELFGDVMVLQEARRLLREEEFLDAVKEKNIDLYTELKDDLSRARLLNDLSKGKSKHVKYSLREDDETAAINNNLSSFFKGLVFGQQWLIAKDIDKAIINGLKENDVRNERVKAERETAALLKLLETDAQAKKRIRSEAERRLELTPEEKAEEDTIKQQDDDFVEQGLLVYRVPNISHMSDKAIGYYLITKMAEGYNKFIFTNPDDAMGDITDQVLYQLGKQVELNVRNTNLEGTMNAIIEENKGVATSSKVSKETARNKGRNVGGYKIFLPAEDEDFLGLLYTLASGRGKLGENQKKFLEDKLLHPYTTAMLSLMKARQTMYKDWKNLTNVKYKGIIKLLRKDSGYGGYLIDQAVRVYLWKSNGFEIPGLDNKDIDNLVEIVRTNPKLRAFAKDVSLLSKQANGYIEPDKNWSAGSVIGDMNTIISKKNREKFLQVWQSNVDKVFSPDNMNKIEAVYGKKYVTALKNMLARMKSGTNRSENQNSAILNWINGSTAVVMFFNMRSAILQTIASVNFINTTDNNIIAATKAMLNPKQWAKDFATIWNSDYLRDRRAGLTSDVAEAELAQIISDPRNTSVMDKFKAATFWLLKKGFTLTRYGDAFAIAFGGSGFYRNRVNTYMGKGMEEFDANKVTMRDFYEIAEVSQQSADVSKISMNQASTLGRLVLAFQNTPLQYSRIIKKSTIDLIKGRGDAMNNISKIIYYSTLQNVLFNFLQNALFSMYLNDDDDDDKIFNSAKTRMINGSLDTLLRGTGFKGAVIATVKNALAKWYEVHGDPKAFEDVMLELLNFSPPIGIKFRALAKAYHAFEYNTDEIIEAGFSYKNKMAIESITSLTSATVNIPLDRLYQKVQNVQGALDDDLEMWQRLAMIIGYNKYSLGLKDYNEPIKIETGKSVRPGSVVKLPTARKQSRIKLPSRGNK